jgi:hypothetical protein
VFLAILGIGVSWDLEHIGKGLVLRIKRFKRTQKPKLFLSAAYALWDGRKIVNVGRILSKDLGNQ